ncbi:MAG: D-alanyl-D-alanine carboxypeptidase [Ruminococcus sp.]|nr:D-alanyl-D-alanine carboxypeptidase [Ruminococcus sp.]
MKKILSIFCTLCLLATLSVVPAGAISFSNDVVTRSESILMVNQDIDQVVFEKNPDEKRYPASTTKIMTYIVAYEHIDDIEHTQIPIKKSVLDQLKDSDSSMAFLSDHVGKTMSAMDLLYSLMVPSGNDAALTLADYVGEGDVDAFVEMMNAKAEELGCENTHFQNPDGLHHKDHYTTARDLYKITTYALTLPYFEEISNTTSHTCVGDDTPLVTTNYLIDQARGGEYYYRYAKGIKTGTTDEAGRCLVTTASADGHSYILVLLGAPYKAGEMEEYFTFTDAANLFRWALVDLQMQTIKSNKTPICEAKVKLAWGRDVVTLVPEKNLNAIVPKDIKNENIVVETELPEVLKAPLSTDKPVGKAVVYYVDTKSGDKQAVATVNLVPMDNIGRSALLAVLDVIGTIFQSYWFIVIIVLIILVVIGYVIVNKIHRARQRKRRKVKKYRNF